VEVVITLRGFRRLAIRRCAALWAMVSVSGVPIGCTDRTNDIDTQAPVAVTDGGVEIVRVERDPVARMIVADVNSTGGEYVISLEAAHVAPFPAGITAHVDGGGEEFTLSVAWDTVDERVWMRQRTSTDELEVTRWVRDGMVHESARLNGVETRAAYPQAWSGELDRALAHWRRGDPVMTPAMAELGGVFARFDAMKASYDVTSLPASPGGELLVSLLNDEQFAVAISAPGDEPLRHQQTIAGTLCAYLSMCTAIACRFLPQACTFCASGVIACSIVDVACRFAGCDCCF